MNPLNDNTIQPYHSGIVECRICGFKFVPGQEEEGDAELHQNEHWKIICGGLPYDIREFLKKAAWQAAECEDGVQGDYARRQQEIAKRAVAFSYWARAISNGIPENEFEAYMAAHLAFADASASDDKKQREEASAVMNRWRKYG